MVCVCLFFCFVVSVWLSSCATTSAASNTILDKPRLSESSNYLIKHGLFFALPDNAFFFASSELGRNYYGFRLSSIAGAYDGLVEYVRLSDTGGSLDKYLQQYQKNAKMRSESYTWQTYIDYFNPCKGVPLKYQVLNEYDDAGLNHVLIAASAQNPDGTLQVLHGQFAVFIVQLRRLDSQANDFAALAEQVLAGMRYAETASDVRRLPDGMYFHSIGTNWHWVSDLAGGMYLSYNEDSANKYMGIALCRMEDASANDKLLMPPEHRPLTTGTRKMIIGRNILQVDYQTGSFPAEHALLGRQEHVMAFNGRFTHKDAAYQLYVRSNFTFNPVNIEMDDSSVLSYLFSTRGGIVDALGFMLELESGREAEQ